MTIDINLEYGLAARNVKLASRATAIRALSRWWWLMHDVGAGKAYQAVSLNDERPWRKHVKAFPRAKSREDSW